MTIRELADVVSELIDDTEIVHTPGRNGDFGGAVISNERAAEELGWRASTPLREGVRRYLAWLEPERAPAAPEPEPVLAAQPEPEPVGAVDPVTQVTELPGWPSTPDSVLAQRLGGRARRRRRDADPLGARASAPTTSGPARSATSRSPA